MLENNKETIRSMFKELDSIDYKNTFTDSLKKYFKKEKKLSDKQFIVFVELYNQSK